MKTALTDLAVVWGITSLVYGVSQYSGAAAWITAGLIVIVMAFLFSWRSQA